jgi:integrase
MSRGKNKLTAVQIRKAKPGVLQDGGGLSLRKTETGGRWNYRYSFAGKRRDMGLGSLADISLAEARQIRDKWAAMLIDGLDPISERDRVRDAEKAAMSKADPTLSEMTDIVFEAKKAGWRGEGSRGRWRSTLDNHVLPKIGNMPISTIHQKDIQKALAPIWRSKHPTAKKAILRLGMIFEQAKLSGYDVDPFTVAAAKHMLGEVKHKPKPIAATPWQDIPDLYEKLDGNAASRLALRMMILTTVRSSALRAARFSEIEGDVWTVPADRMKGTEGHVTEFRVPLSSEAMRVLAICEEYRVNDFLFPSSHAGKHISETAIHKTMDRLQETGQPHGFRTSFRTWVQDTNAASFDVAETALAHTVGNKVERAYARSDLLDQRRILMQKWADYVTGAEAKVLAFPGAK